MGEEKTKFPIEGAIKCPSCGSEKQVGQDYLSELEAEGKVPKGAFKDGLVLNIPIMQALMSPVMVNPEIPVLVIAFDICGKCFTIYSRKVDLKFQPIKVKFGGPAPKGGLNPPFFKG